MGHSVTFSPANPHYSEISRLSELSRRHQSLPKSLSNLKSLESPHLRMAEKNPEEPTEEKKEPTPVASTSKEYEGKFKIGRSVSCSKVENDAKKPEERGRSNSKKRKDPPSPPKVSVKDTKAKFEDIQEKYRNQRNQKDVIKEKSKFKRNCKKTPTE